LRRERRGTGPEEEVAAPVEPLAQPQRGLLRAAVLGQAPGELLGGLLRLELGELGVLLREHRARLQLEQRRDEDQELAAGVEVELALLGEALDEADDDLGEVDLPERQLLTQDEREEEVERPLERVEVQLELADGDRHPRQGTRATGRGLGVSPSPGPSWAAAASAHGRPGRGRVAGGARSRRRRRRTGSPRPRRSAAARRS